MQKMLWSISLISVFILATGVWGVEKSRSESAFLLAEQGKLAELKTLVEQDPSVLKLRDKDGLTLLHLAARGGRLETCEYLLAKGADLRARDSYGSTPLVITDSVPVLDLLLKAGSDINAQNKDGFTALHWATFRLVYPDNDTALALALIERGAQVDLKNKDGVRPLHYAVMGGRSDVVKALIAHGAQVNAPAGTGETPISVAAASGPTAIAELLLQHGAELKTQDRQGWTPLHHAVKEGKAEMAEWLLRHGADPEAKGLDGMSPMFVAAANGQVQAAERLASHGGRVDEALAAKESRGITPLFLAAYANHANMVKWLLEHGAKIDAAAEDGSTALLLAAEQGHREAALTLVRHGADVRPKDKQGLTALAHAAQKDDLELIQALVKAGADLKQPVAKGDTPLHIAAREGYPELIRYLLEQRVDVIAKNGKGQTPLEVAWLSGHYDSANLLAENQGDPEGKYYAAPKLLGLVAKVRPVVAKANQVGSAPVKDELGVDCFVVNRSNGPVKVLTQFTVSATLVEVREPGKKALDATIPGPCGDGPFPQLVPASFKTLQPKEQVSVGGFSIIDGRGYGSGRGTNAWDLKKYRGHTLEVRFRYTVDTRFFTYDQDHLMKGVLLGTLWTEPLLVKVP